MKMKMTFKFLAARKRLVFMMFGLPTARRGDGGGANKV